jgi:hypothetical protein
LGPVVAVTLLDARTVTKAASLLAAKGYIVSVASGKGKSEASPVTRVTASSLKWIKDSECVADLSAIVDQLPGLLHSVNRTGYDASTVTASLYDADFNVQRLMLCWGMLAAVLSSTTDDRVASDMPEPIRSYVNLVRAFESMREGGSETAASLCAALRYNTSAKLTPEQSANALTLFYWAAIHEDDGSRPISLDTARRALQMYVPLGHVVLRKRAYRFSTATKE